MDPRRRFQLAAHEGGFIELRTTLDGTVVWLEKGKSDTGAKTFQRLCIDLLTNSATVFWKATPETLSSKTFRDVTEMQEWLGSHSAT